MIMSTRITLLMLCVFLVCSLAACAPSQANAPEPLPPGVSRQAFDRALKEDRLALVPVDLPNLPEDAKLLTLSPDGKKLLIMWEAGLSVYAVADGSQLPLMPNADKSHLSEDQTQALFTRPEVNAISWSADGRYLSFAFPDQLLRGSYRVYNIWIADLETGMIDPLFELPEEVSLMKLINSDDPPDIPVRAVFDPERALLYYELIIQASTNEDTSQKMRYYQWDYKADKTVEIGETPFEMLSGEPGLRRMGEYLVTTVADRNVDNGSGLAAMSGGKETKLTLEKGRERFLSRAVRYGHLITSYGGDAMLYLGRSEGVSMYPSSVARYMGLLECALDEKGEARYGALFAMDPVAPPDSRLLRFSAEELDDKEKASALTLRFVRDAELDRIENAAFSPDGSYLLLGVPGVYHMKQPPGLYVLNRATGECGRVRLTGELEAAPQPFYYNGPGGSMNSFRWSAGGLLLLCINGGTNRLHELTVGQQ